MAIDKFIYILFIIVISTQFVDISSNDKKVSKKEQPLMILENSIVYSINKNNMDKVVESKVFSKFKTTEVLEDGIIVTRDKDENINNILSADFMIKQNNDIELIDNVKYNKGNNISLNTSKLNYNTKTQIATNKVKFNAIYNKNTIDGTHLYLDTQNNIMKSKNTHFNIYTKDTNASN